MRALAEARVDFEAKLVKTHEEYVSALLKTKFALIIADERAVTKRPGAEDLSLFQIAEEISPGTPFALLYDPMDPPAETRDRAANFWTLSRQDLHLLHDMIQRAIKFRSETADVPPGV
jgi:hypothetical protein